MQRKFDTEILVDNFSFNTTSSACIAECCPSQEIRRAPTLPSVKCNYVAHVFLLYDLWVSTPTLLKY